MMGKEVELLGEKSLNRYAYALGAVQILRNSLWGLSETPPPYVIYCNILARPPPLKTCNTVIFCHKMKTPLPR